MSRLASLSRLLDAHVTIFDAGFAWTARIADSFIALFVHAALLLTITKHPIVAIRVVYAPDGVALKERRPDASFDIGLRVCRIEARSQEIPALLGLRFVDRASITTTDTACAYP